MHPETKKLTQKKHALSNTDRKSKATTKPLFSGHLRHPVRKRSGSSLGQTHTHTHTVVYQLLRVQTDRQMSLKMREMSREETSNR